MNIHDPSVTKEVESAVMESGATDESRERDASVAPNLHRFLRNRHGLLGKSSRHAVPAVGSMHGEQPAE
jgi:hypothetical protein